MREKDLDKSLPSQLSLSFGGDTAKLSSQPSSNRLSQSFKSKLAQRVHAAFENKDSAYADRQALQILEKKIHQPGTYMQDGKLLITLHEDHMHFGRVLLDTINQLPHLAGQIVFRDRGTIRPYQDVVWDLPHRALELSREVYREQKAGVGVRRLVLTPPIITWQSDQPRHMLSRTERVMAKKGEVAWGVLLKTDHIWPDFNKMCDHRYFIQAENLSVAFGGPKDDLKLTLIIPTRAGHCCNIGPDLTVTRKNPSFQP